MKKDNELPFNDKNRIIYVSGTINEQKTEDVVSRLLAFDTAQPNKDIIMIIDSYGGYVDSFVAMHDAMKMISSEIVTICIGKAMSCGQMLLMSGTKGKRFITPNSRVMVHELSSFTGGKLKDIENDHRELQRVQKDVIEKLILKYTKISIKNLSKFMSEDTYLSAEETVKYGIADHIITSPSVLYKRIDI